MLQAESDADVLIVETKKISTMIKIRENFMEALTRRKNEFNRFPEDTRNVAHAMRKKESVAGLPNVPNVVGAIDGSHISIKAPHVNHEDYLTENRTIP